MFSPLRLPLLRRYCNKARGRKENGFTYPSALKAIWVPFVCMYDVRIYVVLCVKKPLHNESSCWDVLSIITAIIVAIICCSATKKVLCNYTYWEKNLIWNMPNTRIGTKSGWSHFHIDFGFRKTCPLTIHFLLRKMRSSWYGS